jgi:hypothetical protein
MLSCEGVADSALHLLSNLCGDSFANREIILEAGFIGQIIENLELLKDSDRCARILAWTVANLARSDIRDPSTLPRKRYHRLIAYLAADLLCRDDAGTALHAANALLFITYSQ